MIREVLEGRREKILLQPSEFFRTLQILTKITKRETVLQIIEKDSSKWRDACQLELDKSFDYVPSMLKKGFESVASQEDLSAHFSETKEVAADIEAMCPGFISN